MRLLLLQFILASFVAAGGFFDGLTPIPKVVPRIFQNQCSIVITHPGFKAIAEEYGKPYVHEEANFLSGWLIGGPRIWNMEPVCLHDAKAGSNCVYTSTWFAGGRGLSLVTSPLEEILLLQAEVFKRAATNPDVVGDQHGDLNLAETRFKQRKIPGKGIGLVATQSIQRGDVIYAKTPLTIHSETAMKALRKPHRYLLMQISVERLPKASRELFFEMKGHFGGNKYSDRVNTNSFAGRLGQAFDVYWNVYPEGARLNHDCRPNTAYNINPDTLVHSMNVLRPIHPGEEITDSYILPYHTWIERRERTHKQWGFNCSCNLCTAPDHVIERSDDRLLMITQLERQLGNLSFALDSRTAGPGTVEALISLYKQERLDGAIAEAYSFAALEYAYIADKHMTQKYAALAVEALQLWRGEWHAATKGFMELLVYPERHSAWNYSAVAREYVKANGSQSLLEAEERAGLQPYGTIFLGFVPSHV